MAIEMRFALLAVILAAFAMLVSYQPSTTAMAASVDVAVTASIPEQPGAVAAAEPLAERALVPQTLSQIIQGSGGVFMAQAERPGIEPIVGGIIVVAVIIILIYVIAPILFPELAALFRIF
jgi:hypothetical protein